MALCGRGDWEPNRQVAARSKAGKKKAAARSRNGYYRKYNAAKALDAGPRTFLPMIMDSSADSWWDEEDDDGLYAEAHPFSEEAFG